MNQLNFISEENLKTHILSTINHYDDRFQSFDLKKFNKNIIDPIKMIFDKSIYGYSWEEMITSEIFRQRDKANNNSIGYFHQTIFQYIDGCTVPSNGWDVIFHRDNGIEIAPNFQVRNIYVEMKNKHNTMNSSAAERTYQKMQNQISIDTDSACFLVEVIAKKSQNDPWKISIDGNSQENHIIRRVSIDKLYQIVTDEEDAFHQ